MDTERWLAPLVGTVAIGTAVAVVSIYAYGISLPERHVATVTAHVPREPGVVFALLADPARRAEWVPHVVRVGRVEDDARGRPVWRELDEGNDRFEFAVADDVFPTFEVYAHKPEEIGMVVTWTWTVSPDGDGARVTLAEDAVVRNVLFRGVWGLRTGPFGQIEADLGALSAHLDGGGVERIP